MPLLPKLLSLDEVAAVARAPRSTILYWCYQGRLRSVKVGRRRLITEADLALFLGLPVEGAIPESDVASSPTVGRSSRSGRRARSAA